jgi:hypothetical protein
LKTGGVCDKLINNGFERGWEKLFDEKKEKLHILLKSEKAKKAALLLVSWMVLYGIKGMMKGVDTYYTLTNSVFALLLYGMVFFTLRKSLEYKQDHRLWKCVLPLALFFAVCMVFGANLLEYGYTYVESLKTWLKIILGSVFWESVLVIAFSNIKNIKVLKPAEKELPRATQKKHFFFRWLCIFVAWIPGLMAAYPGIYAYDSVYQMTYYVNNAIALHHPLIHTYLLGFCVYTLGNLLGSLQLGQLIYSLFQMLCLSCALAFVGTFLEKAKAAKSVVWIYTLWAMFFPCNAIMSFSATKDIIYAATFAVLTVLTAMVIMRPERLKNKKFLCGMIVVFFVNMIFRSQSIYVLTLGLLFGAALFIKKRTCCKRVLGVLVVCLVLYAVYSGPVTKWARGVEWDSLHEMMSVPVMQLGRAATYYPENITEDELALIEEYIPNYNVYPNHQQGISDALKNTFNADRFRENPMEFIRLWVKVGIKNPVAYVDAFARLTIGFWYPDMNERDSQAYHPYWEYESSKQTKAEWIIPERSVCKGFEWLDTIYWKLSYHNSYQRLPLVSLFFSSGITAWLMLAFMAYMVYLKKWKCLFPVSFAFFLWLTLLLSPVVLYRYVYPLVVVVPVWVGLAIYNNATDEVKTENG